MSRLKKTPEAPETPEVPETPEAPETPEVNETLGKDTSVKPSLQDIVKRRRRSKNKVKEDDAKPKPDDIPKGMLEDFLSGVFHLIAGQTKQEHWELSKDESKRLHQATYYVLLKYGAWFAKHFIIVYAVFTLISICLPRILKSAELSKTKLEEKTPSP